MGLDKMCNYLKVTRGILRYTKKKNISKNRHRPIDRCLGSRVPTQKQLTSTSNGNKMGVQV